MTTTAIILAGGLGTRLRTAVPNLPKCLAPVGNYSFLEIQMRQLHSQGVDKFILSLGYMAEAVIDAISPLSSHFDISYVVEKEALGTGGATRFAFSESGVKQAVVTNGDTLLDGKLTNILAPIEPPILFKIAAVEVEDRARYGGVAHNNGIVTGFLEKGTLGRGLINAGIYHIDDRSFDLAPEGAFSLEAELLPKLIERKVVSAKEVDGFFIDIGIPEDYKKFCRLFG